jgi:hypothetical protein
LALLTRRKGQRWRLLALGYAVGLASHIFLDVITAYGTMIFQPLTTKRYTLDTVFIIDLTFASLVLIPQLVAFAWSDPQKGPRRAWLLWSVTLAGGGIAFLLVSAIGVRLPIPAVVAAVSVSGIAFAVPGLTSAGFKWPRSRYCRIGLALSALYIMSCAFAHHLALGRVHQLAAKYHLEVVKIAALPAPPSLIEWSGLVQTPEGVTRFPISLGNTHEPSAERYVNSSDIPNQDQLLSLPKLQTYLWFARFPWITATETSEGRIVEYRDLQFLRPTGTRNMPFTFRVQFDVLGNIRAAELLTR